MTEPALEPMRRRLGVDNPDFLRVAGFHAHQLVEVGRYDDGERAALEVLEAVPDDGGSTVRADLLLKLDGLVGYAMALRDGAAAGFERLDRAHARAVADGRNPQLVKMIDNWRKISANKTKPAKP